MLWSEHAALRWENLLAFRSIGRRRRHSAEAEVQGVPAKPYKHGCVPCMWNPSLQGQPVYEKNGNAKGTTPDAHSSLSVELQREGTSR